MSGRSPVDVSLVVPVYDERESLPLLVEEIGRALGAWGRWTYEIVAVDDGSTDGSLDVLKALKRDHPELHVVAFAHNAGQTAAFAAGFQAARGRVIVTLDADLQNDPADVPALVAELERSGATAVVGYRRTRHDSGWKRRPGCSAARCATRCGRSFPDARRLGAADRARGRRRAQPARAGRAGAPPRWLPALCRGAHQPSRDARRVRPLGGGAARPHGAPTGHPGADPGVLDGHQPDRRRRRGVVRPRALGRAGSRFARGHPCHVRGAVARWRRRSSSAAPAPRPPPRRQPTG